MTGNELREAYTQFFESKGHLHLPSASLIPENDPTLLMIGAGMAPFKPFFTGKMKPPRTRITTCQKCVRTGDIENVGRTARHQTFFEMLGNFSFGDYFKHDAIHWAWEFLTEVLEMPKDKLYVTIYPKDDEAYNIWTQEVGIAPDHVVKLDDNFWEIGPGPCGPDSEIYIDLGEERGCGKPDCAVGCDCDRFLEIWNLVFTQFDRDEDGNYNPLAKKNIDTGAGLERLASVLQGKPSNFETDLLFPIIEYASRVSGVKYGSGVQSDISLKVIADHARSMTVMIGDGILPSNEGRGYVLRRIIRRAIRHGRLLGIKDLFMAGAVDAAVAIYEKAYPEIGEKKDYIKKVITIEEERFQATLSQGMEILNGDIASLKQENKTVLDGEAAFRLYDTFGFPWELTAEILSENGMSLDKDAFDAEMKKQRERARAARQENQRIDLPDLRSVNLDGCTEDKTESATEAKIVCIWENGELVENASDGAEVGIVLSVNPFHAEGGGQVGDSGTLATEFGKADVISAKKLPEGTVYLVAEITEGTLKGGDLVKIAIDKKTKLATARNHTATHLLQAALKIVLGDHVNQAGSSVNADRLRFDFSHFEAVTPEELAEAEKIVNSVILSSEGVEIFETDKEKAKELGAMALFGEKYGDIVRVVKVGDFSIELCGGTHVHNAAEIGLFKIISEGGVASGVRRIEAVTGKAAMDYMNHQAELLKDAAELLKTRPEDIVQKLSALLENVKTMEQSLSQLSEMKAKADAQKLLMSAEKHNGVPFIVGRANVSDMEELRSVADLTSGKLEDGVVILGAVIGDKVSFVVKAAKGAVKKGVHAGNIVKAAAKVTGGGGGGRPDMAQAGGKLTEKIGEAFEAAVHELKAQIK
jgi:alanyl-tRNA synthetase